MHWFPFDAFPFFLNRFMILLTVADVNKLISRYPNFQDVLADGYLHSLAEALALWPLLEDHEFRPLCTGAVHQ